MRRVTCREDGITAVFIFFIMVPLMGMAGYVIDVGIVRQERRELQNGADAAALAAAQTCALDLAQCTPGGLSGVLSGGLSADGFADANAKDRAAAVTGITPNTVNQKVKVDTRTETSGGETSLTLQFAQFFGHATSTVTATATAAWGAPSGATTVPLTFSYCQWKALTGDNVTYPTASLTIFFKDDDVTTCAGPAGQNMPGGFGWLDTNAGPCAAQVTAGGLLGSDPGNGTPNNNGCQPTNFLNKDVLFPVFKAFTGQGQNATYTIYGLATFHITGMRLANSGGWTTNPAPCAANKRCVVGYFLKDIIPWAGGNVLPCSPLAPCLGTQFVKLVL